MKSKIFLRVFLGLVLIFSAVIINLYLLYSFGFFLRNFGNVGCRIYLFLQHLIEVEGRLLNLHLQPVTPPFRTFKDVETLGLALVIILCSWLLSKSLLKTIQITSLCVLPLGLEIYIWDRREFWIHAALIISYSPYTSWFSNADLLLLSGALLIVSTAGLLMKKSRMNVA